MSRARCTLVALLHNIEVIFSLGVLLFAACGEPASPDVGLDADIEDAGSEGDAMPDVEVDVDIDPEDGGLYCRVDYDLNTVGTTIPNGFQGNFFYPGGRGPIHGSCTAPEPDRSRAALIFTFTPAVRGDLIVDTSGTWFDSPAYVRTECLDEQSEIGCGSLLVEMLRRNARLDIDDGAVADQTVFIFLESAFELPEGLYPCEIAAWVRAVGEEGDPCDQEGQVTRCQTGTYCSEGNVCVAGTAPELERASALWVDESHDRARFVAAGHDPEGDIVEIEATFLDGEGATVELGRPPEAIQHYAPEVEGSSDFVAWIELEGLADHPTIEFADIAVVDNAGLPSDSIRAPFVELPRPVAGESCDPHQRFDECVGGLCEAGICGEPTPPSLDEVSILVVQPGQYRLVMVGSDPEGDVAGYEASFVDAAGEDLPGAGVLDFFWEFTWPLERSTSIEAHGQFFFTDVSGADMTPIDAAGLRVELVDSVGNQSHSVVTFWSETMRLHDGDSCDPMGARDLCAEDLVCASNPSHELCVEDLRCPGSYGECALPEDMGAAACNGDIQALEHNVNTIVHALPVMTYYPGFDMDVHGCLGCGCWGPEEVFALTITERSRVLLTTKLPYNYDNEIYTILSIRESCADMESEIACDFYDFGYLAEIELDALEPGTYYVFADAYVPAIFEMRAEVTPL